MPRYLQVESASVYAAVLQNITMEAKPYLAVNYSDESLNKALKACCGQASDGTYGKQKYKQVGIKMNIDLLHNTS